MTTDGTPGTAAGGSGALSGALHPLIHESVARQAEQRPEATAIVFRGDRVGYRTLDAAADHYAEQLAALGAGPGCVIPVQLPRSPQMVACLLAVLKCGAAYAAFDHRWPTERVDALLEQLHAPVFVTGVRVGDTEQAVWQPPSESLEAAAELGGKAPAVDIDPTAPASVFFTSGSTGTPKGVVSPHRAATRLFGEDGLPGYRKGSVATQSAPCPWDMFSLDLWGMLTTGGTSVIVEEDYLLPGALRDLVKAEGVDTAFITTSLFNLFVDMDVDCFEGMRQVYVGGERVSPPHMRGFLERHPGIGLFDGYGPAESCVFATFQPVTIEDCAVPGGVPIGRPCPGTQVYVLDGDQVCEPGAEGEICLGGTGLAQGYLGQPELTAEKFVEITVDGAGVRVYRTGDLGLLDSDGLFHYRGRADRQVKVRGFRIELGEIETAALGLDGVRRCTVVPVPGQAVAWESLALFYTGTLPEGAPEVSEDPLEVGRKLAEFLPPYLIPGTVRALEQFPVRENGKIDSQALLALL